ncbi:hypothetical protein Btru_078121 [Bulinus truncatus]|nr:hypothetical protein Btru_078121 [Bulinus truncatus]
MIVIMSDQISDVVNNENEYTHQKEEAHINKSDFSNFLAFFQTMESYQDFLASERSRDRCEWCQPALDDRSIVDMSLCPCAINLRFRDGGDSMGFGDFRVEAGHRSQYPGEIGQAKNNDKDGVPLFSQSHHYDCGVPRHEPHCSVQSRLDDEPSIDAVPLSRSILNTNLGSSNTNNSSLSRTSCDNDDALQQSFEVAPSVKKTESSGLISQPDESGIDRLVNQSTNVTSLDEVPLYQSGRMLKLSKAGARRNRNFSENRRIPDAVKEKSDHAQTTDPDDASSSKIQSSLIKKITPCDKNTFLCRPAIGSHDNFIEIRYKTADQELVRDHDRPSGALSSETTHQLFTATPYYGSLSCLPTDNDDTHSDIERRLRSSRLATNSLTSYVSSKREERSSFWRKLQIRGVNKLFTGFPSKNNAYQPYKCAQCCLDDTASEDRQSAASLANRPPITSYGLPCYACLRHKLRKFTPNGNRSNNASTSDRGVDGTHSSDDDELLSDAEYCTRMMADSGPLYAVHPLGASDRSKEFIHLSEMDKSHTVAVDEKWSGSQHGRGESYTWNSLLFGGGHQTNRYSLRPIQPQEFKTHVHNEQPWSRSSEMRATSKTRCDSIKIRNYNNNGRSGSRHRNNFTTYSGKAAKPQPDAANTRRGSKRKSQSKPKSPESKRRKISSRTSQSPGGSKKSNNKSNSGRCTKRVRRLSDSKTDVNRLCFVCQQACAEKDVESLMQCFMCHSLAHNDCAQQDSPGWWWDSKPEDNKFLCHRCSLEAIVI